MFSNVDDSFKLEVIPMSNIAKFLQGEGRVSHCSDRSYARTEEVHLRMKWGAGVSKVLRLRIG